MVCLENIGYDVSCWYVIDSCVLKSVICFFDVGKNVKFWIKIWFWNLNFFVFKYGFGFWIYINLYWNRYKDIKLELIVEGFFNIFFFVYLYKVM